MSRRVPTSPSPRQYAISSAPVPKADFGLRLRARRRSAYSDSGTPSRAASVTSSLSSSGGRSRTRVMWISRVKLFRGNCSTTRSKRIRLSFANPSSHRGLASVTTIRNGREPAFRHGSCSAPAARPRRAGCRAPRRGASTWRIRPGAPTAPPAGGSPSAGGIGRG